MTISRVVPVLVLVLVLVLEGCAGDGQPGPDAAPDAATVLDAATLADSEDGSGPDAAADSATASDAGPDAGSPGDATPDTALDVTEAASIAIPGLSAPVTQLTDAEGFVHLSCRTDADCLAALGYVQASRRFFRMDLARRGARGTAATLYGTYGLENDRTMRHYLSTPQGVPLEQAVWERLAPDTQALLTAYAAGVNAWLADLRAGRNGARPNEEYTYRHPLLDLLPDDVLETIPDWDPRDSVGLWVSLMQGNGDLAVETSFVAKQAALSPELWSDLVAPYPLPGSDMEALLGTAPPARGKAARRAPQPAAPVARLTPALVDGIGRHAQALERARAPLPTPLGSNSWALGPAVTGGAPVLGSDPHGPLGNPPYADLYVLDAVTAGEGTLHVGGVFMAGLPVTVIGFNERVGWGCTVSYADVTDYYVETLTADGEGVVFNGEPVPFVTRTDTIEVAGGAAEEATFRWVPHHGPVITLDAANGYAVTRRWTGHAAPRDLEAWLGLMRAADVDGALAALELAEATGCNATLVDATGRTAWHVGVRVPSRPWAGPQRAPWLALPGDGSAEWDGFLPLAAHPRAVDPPAGAVVSANNAFDRSWEDGDPTNDAVPYRQSYLSPGYRAVRIGAVLDATAGGHDAAASVQLQRDTRSPQAEGIVPALLAAAAGAPEPPAEGALPDAARALVAALEEWDFTCPTGLLGPSPDDPPATDEAEARAAIGCTAYHAALVHATTAAFRDELQAADHLDWFSVGGMERSLYRACALPDTLASGAALWDDVSSADRVETRDETLRAGLVAAAQDLVARLGPDPDGWRWGRVHTLTLRAALDITAWHLGPYAAPGAMLSVNPGPFVYEEQAYAFAHGPAMRLVVAFTESGPQAQVQLPGGLDLHRDNPFYANLIERWLVGTPVPLPFDRAATEAGPHERRVLVP